MGSLLSVADDASPRLQHKVKAELAEHREHLVQPHRWLTLLEGMNETR